MIAEHVLLPHAGSILDAHERMAAGVSRALLEEVAALVPAQWLGADAAETYVDYLTRRLYDAPFAEEAERARLAT